MSTRNQGGYWYAHAIWSSDLSPTARLVALVIAGAADNESGRLKVSLTTLQQRTGLARSSVARTLKTLEVAGFIKRHPPEVWRAIKEHDATVYTTVIPSGFPTKASPAVGLATPRASATAGLGLVPYATKASPTVGLSTTSTNGAAAGSATATPPTTYLADTCGHGITGGLIYRAGSFVCGECEAIAPGEEFFDWVRDLRSRGITDTMAEEIFDAAVDRDDDNTRIAGHVASATYPHMGGTYDDHQPLPRIVNHPLMNWLSLCVYARLDSDVIRELLKESA